MTVPVPVKEVVTFDSVLKTSMIFPPKSKLFYAAECPVYNSHLGDTVKSEVLEPSVLGNS